MDALDRMFTALVQALRTKFPELLDNPFEVAELYQTLIPYRHYRREIGLESNADYELTLMALLSGARGYIVGDGRMQDTLRAALAAPEPDTSLFRTFATSRVAVATDALRRFDQSGESGAEETPPLGSEPARSVSASRFAEPASSASRAQDPARPNTELPPAYSHPLGKPLYGTPGTGHGRGRATPSEGERPARVDPDRVADREQERAADPGPVGERMRERERETSLESFRASRESRREPPREVPHEKHREPVREPLREAAAESSLRNPRDHGDRGRGSSRESAPDRPRETSGESFREPARQPHREPHITPSRMPARSASLPPSPTPSSTSSSPAHAHLAMTTPSRSTTASALGGNCRYCGGTLPDGRRLVFCPHCGQNLTIQHCPACSTELELGWKYCTTCGRSVASA